MQETMFRVAAYRHAGDTHQAQATMPEPFSKALKEYRKAVTAWKSGFYDWPFMPILEEFNPSSGMWSQSLDGMRAAYRLRMKDDQGKLYTPQDRGYFGTFEDESKAWEASSRTTKPSFVQAWDGKAQRWVKAKVPGSLAAA